MNGRLNRMVTVVCIALLGAVVGAPVLFAVIDEFRFGHAQVHFDAATPAIVIALCGAISYRKVLKVIAKLRVTIKHYAARHRLKKAYARRERDFRRDVLRAIMLLEGKSGSEEPPADTGSIPTQSH